MADCCSRAETTPYQEVADASLLWSDSIFVFVYSVHFRYKIHNCFATNLAGHHKGHWGAFLLFTITEMWVVLRTIMAQRSSDTGCIGFAEVLLNPELRSHQSFRYLQDYKLSFFSGRTTVKQTEQVPMIHQSSDIIHSYIWLREKLYVRTLI